MGLFKQYLDRKYPAMGWQTKDPDELSNAFYDFLGDPANAAAADELAEKNRVIYDMYRKDVEKDVEKTKTKLGGLTKTPLNQQPTQKAHHIRLLVGNIDEKAERIVMQGKALLASKPPAKTEEEKILDGEWEPDINNTIPAPAAVNCNPYKLKHFGADSSAAQYLGRFKDNPKLVKALEEKAKSALLLDAVIFRFNENVGHDGTKGPNSPMTKCIRVDSVGTDKEHSHPIPESNDSKDSPAHDTYIKKNIIKCHNENDRESLIDIAKYLTIIGAKKGEYTFTLGEKNKLNGKKFSFYCYFWNPKPS
jgi:hypothetical protein